MPKGNIKTIASVSKASITGKNPSHVVFNMGATAEHSRVSKIIDDTFERRTEETLCTAVSVASHLRGRTIGIVISFNGDVLS